MIEIKNYIKDVPNFPKAGVLFKDITPLLADAEAFQALCRHFKERLPKGTTKLVSVESRGFILGAALAQHCGCGIVLVRKPGKLPRETHRETYSLEYGEDSLEIHKDDLGDKDSVTIIDDVLATGGTAAATEKLCEKLGAKILGSLFLMEIDFLKGRQKLKYSVDSLMKV